MRSPAHRRVFPRREELGAPAYAHRRYAWAPGMIYPVPPCAIALRALYLGARRPAARENRNRCLLHAAHVYAAARRATA